MKQYPVNKIPDLISPVAVEIKEDGISAIFSNNGKWYCNKTGKELTEGRIKELKTLEKPHINLIGELLGTKDEPRKFIVWDIDKRGNWYQKRKIINSIVNQYNSNLIKASRILGIVNSKEKIINLFNKAINNNEEGVVIKPVYDLDNDNWYKLKKEITWDYVITGVEISRSKTLVKNIKLGLYNKNNELIMVGKCGTMPEYWRKEFIKKEYIGKVVEIKGYKLFKTGALRHPSFIRLREDKLAIDCKMPEIEIE